MTHPEYKRRARRWDWCQCRPNVYCTRVIQVGNYRTNPDRCQEAKQLALLLVLSTVACYHPVRDTGNPLYSVQRLTRLCYMLYPSLGTFAITRLLLDQSARCTGNQCRYSNSEEDYGRTGRTWRVEPYKNWGPTVGTSASQV